jgi:signal transduction histidine kinase
VKRLLPFRTLRGRLTLLAALTTLPTFLFVVYIAGKERAEALRRAETEARFVAVLASREHANQAAGAHRLLEALARNDSLAEGTLGTLPSLLPSILSGFPQVANLWIVSANGRLEYSVVPARQPVSLRQSLVFQQALAAAGGVTGHYQVGPIVGRPVLLVARALRGKDGIPHHVLIAALELSWLDRLARQSGLPSRSVLVIADRNGAALAGARGSVGSFRELVAQPGRMRKSRIEGTERLAVAVPLGGVPGLWVVAGQPERDVYAVANRIFVRDTTVLALLALFTVVVSLLTTDLSVLRDLRVLGSAANRFGSGDLAARVQLPASSGEIRELAVAFNAMADSLEAREREEVATRQRLRALTERLSAAREQEAARIAQELHDQLGQELTVLKFELETLRRGSKGTVPLDATIAALEASIDTAIETVRRISSELRPGVLDRLGLVAGLEWLLREFERRTGIATDLAADAGVVAVDPSVSTALFRIVQEGLTNVARHAGASLVEVEIRDRQGMIELRLRDDGQGFDDAEARNRPSLGLLGIEERAHRLGGRTVVQSSPGKGTSLLVTVPRHPEQEKGRE